MSKGEEKIARILCAAGAHYEKEVVFKNLNGRKGVPLRYDFAIYKNGKVVCLLEFDGEFHFTYHSHFNKKKSDFAYRKECDRKKNNYALAHKIPLYRIPYWEIENINSYESLFKSEFLVKTQYHNDILINSLFGGG